MTASFSPPIDLTQLDRYLAGQMSMAEAEEFVHAVGGTERLEEVVMAFRGALGATQLADHQRAQELLQTRIATSEEQTEHDPVPRPSNARRPLRSLRTAGRVPSMVWQMVAAAAIVAVVSVFATLQWPRHLESRARSTYVTGNGEHSKIELSDGTTVLLNVASRLEIPEDFGHGTRTIRLRQGEAYFIVAHTAGIPFKVEAAGTRETVLGTEFGVRAYSPSDVQVAVRSGRVMVDTTVLSAQDIAHVSVRGQILVARHQTVEAALGFASGKLVLADESLRDVIEDLNRWYDVDLRLGDSTLGALPIRATLAVGSAGDLVDILQQTFDIRVDRHGRVLTLYSR